MLKGRTITLYERTEGTADAFNRPSYTETPVTVANVLIAPVSSEDMISELNLSGKRAVYQLGIPKGDAHSWEGCRVNFFGQDWRVIGYPTEGQEEMIPLSWNRKVTVERWNDAEIVPPNVSEGTT